METLPAAYMLLFDATICFTTAETPSGRALFPRFKSVTQKALHRSCAVAHSFPPRIKRVVDEFSPGEWLDCPHHCSIEASEGCRNESTAGPIS
jgi:hypothetical protein